MCVLVCVCVHSNVGGLVTDMKQKTLLSVGNITQRKWDFWLIESVRTGRREREREIERQRPGKTEADRKGEV